MIDIKNEVLYRVYAVMIMIAFLALIVFAKAVRIQYWEGDKWRAKGEAKVKIDSVNAERGNIITEDGKLLATSLPFFEIHMDPNSEALSEEDFMAHVDTLAQCLAIYTDWTPGGLRDYLINARLEGKRYVFIKKNVSYTELEKIRQFPLFNLGQFRGGFIVKRQSKRDRPFGVLAHRTIGYVREGAKKVGLEGFFDEELGGVAGKRLMRRVGNDVWIPVNDLTEIEPHSGNDIVTTINIDIQEIAHKALLRALEYHNADNGTAIIMEVKTGAIRAISNLGRTSEGWWETYNHAVGSAVEPGSTYKLAPIMALMEDFNIDLNDSIDLEKGLTMFYEEEMRDASYHLLDTTTIRKAFEISSNVGIAKLVNHYYSNEKKAEDFVKRLKSFRLHLPTGIEIEGEAPPYIKEANNKEQDWSGTTLPWMSIGYEVEITPLQLLTFYNAVANDGKMMQPYLISEIQHFGETLKSFKPTILNKKIASDRTIEKAKELLEGVVESGTASKLHTRRYRFAGKTGTAQIDYKKFSPRKDIKHRASFAGYFPAENPIYSCIVMITNPKQNGIYGGEVAGPVFREIADNCFNTRIELHKGINEYAKPQMVSKRLPNSDVGAKSDLIEVLNYFQLPFVDRSSKEWAVLLPESDTLSVYSRTMTEDVVPNVTGMGLRDALFILENRGLRVVVVGTGKIVRQSIIPGTRIKGQTIKLTLR